MALQALATKTRASAIVVRAAVATVVALASGGALWAVTTFGIDLQPPVMIGAVVASAIAAFFVGKRLHVERCPGKDCRCPLKPDELVCPACGLVVPPRATKEA